MKLPFSVPVGDDEIRVVRRRLKPDTKKGFKYGHAVESSEGQKHITVSWGIDDDAVLSTYLHELFHHAVPDLDEKVVRRLESTAMTALIRLKPGREKWEWVADEARWLVRRK